MRLHNKTIQMKGEKHMEYSNLIGEIAKAHINYVDIAKRLGITRDTLRAKITGKSSFTVEEAFTIKNEFFPNCQFEQLFARSA